MRPSDTTSSNNPRDREDLLDDVDQWENRELGADPKHTRRARRGRSADVDAKLGLKMISIRLQEELIDDFKQFAAEDGIGYQPLIRRLLNCYAEARRARQRSDDADNEEPHAQA